QQCHYAQQQPEQYQRQWLDYASGEFTEPRDSNDYGQFQNGTVTILPVLASTTIGLANSAANINLSQTNLTNITAGTLIIGSTSGGMTGSITIGTSGGSTTVSVGNVSNLLLANTGSGTVAELSSNTLSVGGGSGNLAVSTAGSITLGNANAV